MLRIEHRQMYRSNGLIDDFVLYGTPADYVALASKLGDAGRDGRAEYLRTDSSIHIEILRKDEQHDLRTSLQNEDDFYPTLDAWQRRNILRISGSAAVLERLSHYLVDVSGRGEGYSYISECPGESSYLIDSPEWRLHVQAT